MQSAARIITSTRAERFEQYGHPLYEGAVEPADDARFSIIPPGINERIFHADASGDDPDFVRRLQQSAGADGRPVVLASSRLDAKKNVAGFVDAWLSSAELRERARLALFVRGVDDPFSGIERLRADEREVLAPILARIESAGLRDQVVFVNAGSQRQLASAYRFFARCGSVFVLPSLHEPFGLAPIEAAACGLAVVATRHGGPSEVFAGGIGVLVEPEDPENMAHGMLAALERQQELAGAAALMVQRKYTWRRTAEGYLGVIRELVAGAGKREMARPGPLDASDRIANWLERHG